jgi:hypothetical protein
MKCSSAHKIKYFYALSKIFCAKIDSPYTLNETRIKSALSGALPCV